MENFKKLIIFSVFLISNFFISASFADAYDNKIAHPIITDETIRVYNIFYENKLESGEDQLLRQGSIDEDDPVARTINHFYDPIREIGINDSRPTTDWAFNGDIVSNDFSWPKIIQYYAEGDREKALIGLGHILHLVQDMSVPPHTRNDPHMGDGFSGLYTGKSIYEEWVKKNIPKDFKIDIQRNDLWNYNDPLDVFKFLANYSNKSFFSRDTIKSSTYTYPRIEKINELFGFSTDLITKELKESIIVEKDDEGKTTFFLETDDRKELMGLYFNRLSKQAVIAGANLIDLFFKEAIPAREDYLKMQELVQEQRFQDAENLVNDLAKKGTLGLIAFGIKDWFNQATKKVADTTRNFVSDLDKYATRLAQDGGNLINIGKFSINNLASPGSGGTTSEDEQDNDVNTEIITFNSNQGGSSVDNQLDSGQNTDEEFPKNSEQDNLDDKIIEPVVIVSELQVDQESETQQEPLVPFGMPKIPLSGSSPGFGGGGGSPNTDSNQNQTQESNNIENKIETEIFLEPPVIISPEDDLRTNQTNILFKGTAMAGTTLFILLNNATTTELVVSEDGNWQLTLNLNSDRNVLGFLVGDRLGNFSQTVKLNIFVDTAKPDIYLTILECQSESFAFQNNNCLISPKIINPVWNSTSEDLDYFLVDLNGSLATTTATSTSLTLNNNEKQYIKVASVDKLNNQSEWKEVSFDVERSPIVFNEIAWQGTNASAYDEWIELYNNTDQDINLDNWVLRASDGSPYLDLSGTIIKSRSYYLIERKSSGDVDELTDSPVIDLPADLWTSFGSGLSNDGEELFLEFLTINGTTTVDHIPYCQYWCYKGKSSGDRSYSMEKISPLLAGDDYDNWKTSDVLVFSGLDVKGNEIKATPGKRNGNNYILNFGNKNFESDTIITKDNSPYIAGFGDYKVPSGITVSIEEGVVIKFLHYVNFNVEGRLEINGKTDEKTIFTSFENQSIAPIESNYVFKDPTVYDWYGLHVLSGGEIDANNFVMSYMGKTPSYAIPCLSAVEAKVSIRNSVIEKCAYVGIEIDNSEISLINNKIINPGTKRTRGIDVSSSSGEMKDNLIDGYHTGFWVEFGRGLTLDSNTANNNEEYPFYVHFPKNIELRNNNGQNNYTDAIRFNAEVGFASTTVHISKNYIPYVLLSGIVVPADSSVVIDPGVVLKTYRTAIDVQGELSINGSADEPVLFTSVKDKRDGTDLSQGILDIIGPVQLEQKILVKEDAKLEVKNAKISFMNFGIEYSSASSTINLENVWFDQNKYGLNFPLGINIEKFSGIKFTGAEQIPATVDLVGLGLDFLVE